jgi:predicted dehydrogenase
MPNDKLRVGIIGMGAHALFDHVPNLRKTGKAEIVAISRRDPERLAMAKEALNIPEAYTDWREMLEGAKLDAVVVSTSHNAHAEPTLSALDRGLHVLVEKPMCLTSKDAWAMVDAAERANRVLMVGYPNRLSGIWRTVKRMLEDGRIGRVRQINLAVCGYRRWFWEGGPMPDDAQKLGAEVAKGTGIPVEFFAGWGHGWHREPAKMGGGMFADTGTHQVGLMLWLGGAPPIEVVAFTESAGLPVECFVNISARLANGVLLSIASADDDGVLTDDSEGSIWVHLGGERKKLEAEAPDLTKAGAFVSAIEGGENLSPAVEGEYAVALTEAAYRSAAEGRIVRVDLPEAEKGKGR